MSLFFRSSYLFGSDRAAENVMLGSRHPVQVVVLVVVFGSGLSVERSVAQGTVPRIWSGIYTAAQADRGKTVFQGTCTTCHNFDLKGNTGRGPALVGEPFMTNWETENLNALFTRLKTTMPRNNPGSLTEDIYTDLLAYILQSNAYPQGSTELNTAGLGSIYILQKDGTSTKGVPNFAMVAMVGCLAQMNDRWVLTHTSEPVITEERPATEAELKDARSRSLGDSTFRLIGVNGYEPDTKNGHKVQAKGLLYRVHDDNRLNVTGMQTLSSSCPN